MNPILVAFYLMLSLLDFLLLSFAIRVAALRHCLVDTNASVLNFFYWSLSYVLASCFEYCILICLRYYSFSKTYSSAVVSRLAMIVFIFFVLQDSHVFTFNPRIFRSASMQHYQKKSGRNNASYGQHLIIHQPSKLLSPYKTMG